MKITLGALFLGLLLCCSGSAFAICVQHPDDPPCPPSCGDGVCSTLERNSGSCPDDCGTPVCGDGTCQKLGGENGGTCGKDCCDFNTGCYQTYLDQGVLLCRRWSTNNGGTWTAYGWKSISDYNTQYCSQQSHVCVNQSNCHNTYAVCVHTTGSNGRFEILPTASCP